MFSFDFSNVSLNRPPSEAGVYTVKITDVDSYKARSGALRIGFKSTITDGTHEGCTINDGFNIPKSMSGKGISFWVDFFESLGMNKSEWSSAFSLPDLTVTESDWADMSAKQRDKMEEKVMNAVADCLRETCVGLVGYCYYAPAVEEGSYPTKRWVKKSDVKKKQAAIAAAPATNSALDGFINL